ncbi:hypothetical protein JCM9279_005154 [Rhodotorula babjevae]
MPTPRAPRSASPSPFDLLPRLISPAASGSLSSSLSSPSSREGSATTDPLLPHSFHPSSRPATPHSTSHRRSTSLSAANGHGKGLGSGAYTPTTPTSPAASASFADSPPKAARRSSARRWVALVAVALVCGLALSSRADGHGEGGDGYAASVREGWRVSVEGVRSWTGGRWQGGGEPPGRVEEVGDGEKTGAPLAALAAAVGGGEGAEVADEGRLGEGMGDSMLDLDEDPAALSTQDFDDGEAAPAASSSSPAPPVLNVNPHPRPVPRDPKVVGEMRFLSFENHSGFHNQRKSLVNALVLAQLLNRTLLLPPARLGSPVPWEMDPKFRVAFSERCKAGLEPDKPIATLVNAHAINVGEACEDPLKWTYTGWDWLISPSLLAGRSLVDRWNSSSVWFTAPLAEGGLGLTPDEIHQFADADRRSYQILDDRRTSLSAGSFTSRIELDDLRDEAGLGGKRLLRFGSLFSSARLKFVQDDNARLLDDTTNAVVLESGGLDGISDRIRNQLGSYVAAHARLGDGVFKSKAVSNMQNVFRQLGHDVLGLRKEQVDALLAEVSSSPPAHKSASKKGKGKGKNAGKGKGGGKKKPRAFGSPAAAAHLRFKRSTAAESWAQVDDDYDEADLHLGDSQAPASPLPFALSTSHLGRRALKGGPAQPLASSLHCRRPLHDVKASPHLARLNVPLYIATDSRSPTTDPALEPFNRWFPCVFFLSDFAQASEVNDAPVAELEELVEAKSVEEGGARWVSDWDGQAMARYLFPFLEAEIAARAVEVVGTPQSTFSGYVRGILHQAYLVRGITASWRRSA